MAKVTTGRAHKAFVIVTDEVWRDFRILCMSKGESLQDYLGYLVAKEVKTDKAAKTRQAARKVKAAKIIDAEIRRAGETHQKSSRVSGAPLSDSSREAR